jgi:phosphoserine phosphatase RsbU/P
VGGALDGSLSPPLFNDASGGADRSWIDECHRGVVSFRVMSRAETTVDQLRRVASITDPDLAHLQPSELLDEVLARVQDLLSVDTVAVLRLDHAGSQLIAYSARGLEEEEVRQGVRVPMGRGFAGRIAATRVPLALADVGPDTVVNPILSRRGVRSLLGVPLIASGALLGVMHVGTLQRREFSEDATTILQLAADRIATVLSVQQAADERLAARTLQQSLLPTRLPDVDGLEFATRFVAAEKFGVGGDWFDAFKLPDGQVGIVIGDVAGSGLRAAVVMGRLRSALRAYAIESSSPAQALERLDRKFAHFEPDEMATVLYMTVASDLASFTLSSRGHPPPVIAEHGHEARVLECRPSPPIGAHLAARHVDVVSELRPGTTVGCYTDGLIERRAESIDRGLERLRSAFQAGPVEVVCTSVMSELVGAGAVEDDTALFVFRRVP